ncbi:restriction endonuclease [Brevibacillus massiliensis]|uniref:restriction endonuclease n=1 Tax=Brevibacillus massiliensis TaxID=1118054 RepID=UPI0002DD988E|nr:restriction endonuclease [Brevibacillus massiliensis]
MGKFYYEETIYNEYLGKVKTIKAETLWELDLKVSNQIAIWDKQEKRLKEKERVEDLKSEAEYETEMAREMIQAYTNILQDTLNRDDKLDWNSQMKNDTFPEFEFEDPPSIEEIKSNHPFTEPSLFEKIFLRKRVEKRRKEHEEKITELFQQLNNEYQQKRDYALNKFNEEKEKFHEKQEKHNTEIMNWKYAFENGETEAIEKYIKTVLASSTYPSDFEIKYDIQYLNGIQTIIVNYHLPSPDQVPNITEYKYVVSKKEIVPKKMKAKEFEQFYNSIVFQTTLRTIHEIFESDYTRAIQVVVFNGWVNYIDESNGLEVTSCIITVQTTREEFERINLSLINPQKCIQSLKGLYAGSLINLGPVKPIMNINTDDSRFVESKDVLSELNSYENLATMPWEEFEHLVRGLFAKMFSEDGAEVNVTRASRDGGVDAIAFDPDPIKGGKFVIQAKRYNNVVPVSAVRDLFGTMIHEGATKGILVTTSSFGKDAYEFVKDKPITLIDGQNLLFLFNKYGYSNVKIMLSK